MRKLTELINELHPDGSVTGESALIDDGILTSLDIVALVTDLNDAYGIEIGAEDITPENFNSVDAIASLIKSRGGDICS